MTRFQHVTARDGPQQYGDDAIESLTSLITEATSCSDEERLSILNRVLCDVEMLLQLTWGRMIDDEHPAPTRSVHEQQAAFHPSFDDGGTTAAADASSTMDEPEKRDFKTLTVREQQIIEHLTHGATNKEIARELDITEATVKVHIKTILRKLGLKNRTQVALRAIQRARAI